jgi:hypothetical protein
MSGNTDTEVKTSDRNARSSRFWVDLYAGSGNNATSEKQAARSFRRAFLTTICNIVNVRQGGIVDDPFIQPCRHGHPTKKCAA